MSDQSENLDPQRSSRRRLTVAAVAIVAVVGVVAGAVALGNDDGSEDAAVTSDSAAVTSDPVASSTSLPAAEAPTETDAAPVAGDPSNPSPESTDDADDPAPPASPATTLPPRPDPIDIVYPDLPVIEDTESATCIGVRDSMIAYREIAASSPISAFLELQLALEEFENVADFVGQGQDWGVRIVEQINLVRRDWSTAYTAEGEGDTETANARMQAALGYLDAAIDVPCPEE